MKKLRAFGAIGMLITLLIIGLMFAIMMPTLKDTGFGGLFGKSSLNQESVETQINDKIKDIENYKQQNINYIQQNSQE